MGFCRDAQVRGEYRPIMNSAGTLDADGAQIYYEVEGAGPPVVLIHGALSDTRIWEPQVDALAERFTVVRFDQRGYGRSTKPDTPYRSHEDFRRVFEALGLDRPHLVGSSMGGRFAIDYAVAYPDELRSLVVHVGGISGDDDQDPAVFDGPAAVAQAVARGDFAEAMRLVFQLEPMRRAAADAEIRERLETIIGDHAWRSFQEPDPWLDTETPATEHLGEIGVATLVMTGEHDIADHHRQARLLADGIPEARLVVIPGASHMVNLEQPDLFNGAVLDFLLEQSAVSSGDRERR